MSLDSLEAITDGSGYYTIISLHYNISLRFLCICIYGFNPESWINPKNVWAGRMTECLPTSKSLIEISSSASKKLTPPRKKMKKYYNVSENEDIFSKMRNLSMA